VFSVQCSVFRKTLVLGEDFLSDNYYWVELLLLTILQLAAPIIYGNFFFFNRVYPCVPEGPVVK